MTIITDEFMMGMPSKTKIYSLVILKPGPHINHPDFNALLWEHARRNFALREEGILSIVCPVSDESEIKAIGIFNADEEKTRQIMAEDICIKEGVFVFEIHPARSFPGDSLPA
jgi:hypothetical protein